MMQQGRLGEMIPHLMRRWNLERRLRQRAAMDLWPQVVGADIARNAWPLGVRDGVLRVGARNHAWVQTLHLMRAQILEALNQRLGEPVLRDLHLRVASRDERRAAAPPSPAPAASAPPLSGPEQRWVRELGARVSDPALRAKVERAAAGLLRLRHVRRAQGWRPCPRCGAWFAGGRGACPACRGRR